LPQSALEGGHAKHLARGDVIGMAIVPERNGDRARPMTADQVDGGSDHLGGRSDPAVGPAKILAPARAQHARRGEGLLAPVLDGAVARHLAFGEIAEPDDVAGFGVPGDRATQADLEIVGVWTKDEQIDRHRQVNSIAWPVTLQRPKRPAAGLTGDQEIRRYF